MTLRVALKTHTDVAGACRLVRRCTNRQLVPARDAPVSTGLFSVLPGTVWVGQCVANWRGHEVRCAVEVPGAAVSLRSEAAWTAGVYGVLGDIDLRIAPPTWDFRSPRRRQRWARPGGCGQADATFLARVSFRPDEPVALLAVPQGVEVFLIRRIDEAPDAVPLVAETMVRTHRPTADHNRRAGRDG